MLFKLYTNIAHIFIFVSISAVIASLRLILPFSLFHTECSSSTEDEEKKVERLLGMGRRWRKRVKDRRAASIAWTGAGVGVGTEELAGAGGTAESGAEVKAGEGAEEGGGGSDALTLAAVQAIGGAGAGKMKKTGGGPGKDRGKGNGNGTKKVAKASTGKDQGKSVKQLG